MVNDASAAASTRSRKSRSRNIVEILAASRGTTLAAAHERQLPVIAVAALPMSRPSSAIARVSPVIACFEAVQADVQIGSASCGEGVCREGEIWGVAVDIKKKK